jgi:predicted nucleic acid-binding protein
MSALEFTDTNIVAYAMGKDSEQRTKARRVLAEGVTVNTQVINETVNVLTRKQARAWTRPMKSRKAF